MLSLRGIMWEYGCKRGTKCRSTGRPGFSLPRLGLGKGEATHHTKGQLLVQWIMG